MRVVYLQISRVLSTNDENEPIYETYPITLNDDGTWTKFLSGISVMGYVKRKTEVIKVVEIDKNSKSTDIDKAPYQKELEESFTKKVNVEKPDYKLEFEKERKLREEEKQRNDDLLRRLEALELSNQTTTQNKEDDVELAELRFKYETEKGNIPDQRWGVKKLKSELNIK